MNNEVRKPPRPSVKRMITIRAQIGEWNEGAFSKEELYRICEDLLAELDHKEILPGDDRIRVKLKKAIRLLADEMKELSNCGCGHEEGNGLCRTHYALEILVRIERESKGE